MLGVPRKGIHAIRIFNIAVVDVVLTIITAYLVKLALPAYNVGIILLVLFLLGIAAHRLFCVKTTIDIWLFGTGNDKNIIT